MEGGPRIQHRGSDPKAIMTGEPLGLSFDGMLEDMYQFTVQRGPRGSEGITFYVRDLAEVEGRLQEKFEQFKVDYPKGGQAAYLLEHPGLLERAFKKGGNTMATEYYQKLTELQGLTEVNLSREMKTLQGYGEEAINFANRCDSHLALKSLAFADFAREHLADEAQRRFINGAITGKEFTDIIDKSLEMVVNELTMEIANNLMMSCDCRKA